MFMGCGDDGGDGGDDGGGDSVPGGDDDASPAVSSADCTGAFATTPAPYTPNTSIDLWGGFYADDQGLVFSVISDTTAPEYDAEAEYPSQLMVADTSGNVETLFTYPDTAMPGPIVAHGDDVYFAYGLLGSELAKIPRQGGEPTIITDAFEAGLTSDGTKLYFASSEEIGVMAVESLDLATGERTSLASTEKDVVGIAVDGSTVYWIEQENLALDEPADLYQVSSEGGDAQHVMTIPADMGLGSFHVTGGAVYGSTITDDLEIQIHRAALGGASYEVVEDQGGVPMVFSGTAAYYGGVGLIRNSLAFDNRTVVEGSSGRSIYAIAVGPSDLWYADHGCLFRAPL